MERASADLLGGLLKGVSRSFYLTLRVLPRAIRPQISLAYLLARASDTIADTDVLPREKRLELLSAFGERILRDAGPALGLEKIAGHQSSAAERRLLQRLEEAFHLLTRLAESDRAQIREVLTIIISGQSLDLERFSCATGRHIVALENAAELDDYTYRVAGCVGEFWTRMCRRHLFPTKALDDAGLLQDGVRFGKGLQLINVLRDLPLDLRQGRCYLPKQDLAAVGLLPADLLAPANEPRLRPIYDRYLDAAEEHLEAGWRYTNELPFGQVRVRLACAWPILIGARTILRLRATPVLDPARRVKISRQDVRAVLVRSVLWYPWPTRWHALFRVMKATRRNTLPREASLAK
jgi:farnesyl-diphosphate farnesyltransferase